MAKNAFEIILNFDGKKLSKTIEIIGKRAEQELANGIKNLAYGAYSKIISNVQSNLKRTRQDYLKGLKIESLSDSSYFIYLDGSWPNKLETGFPAYDMRDTLLRSNKTVSVGSRAGQKWVQESKKGDKFAHIPFEKKPFSKELSGGLDGLIKSMQGYGTNGVTQKITKIFKDEQGSPLEGKVAVGKHENPFLDQLVKYQKIYRTETGKETVQSVYVNYRTISEASAKFMHPGWRGLHAFADARNWLEKEIDNLIKNLGR